MSVTPIGTAFKIAYELSPIYLTGGSSSIIGSFPGQIVPFIAFTEGLGLNLLLSVASGGENIELDDFFAHFIPMPGTSLIDYQIATYPFANQAIAANAVIQQPLNISMRMICPVRNRLGYAAKIATMMLIKQALDQHNNTGGTYSILTPSYFYTDCVMMRMTDISGGSDVQAQHTWQLDFQQPLVTLDAAQSASQGLMGKLTNGGQVTDPSWSGANAAVGGSVPGNISGFGVTAPTEALGGPIGAFSGAGP
jgi:hypothetical protein